MGRILWFGAAAIISTSAAISYATTIHVPADQPTIQAGIDAAVNGDTVLLANGVYTGEGNRDMSFNGKAIHVASANGPLFCRVDCQGSESEPHRAFVFNSGEGPTSVLSGITIVHGYGTANLPTVTSPAAGAIACINVSNPSIRNCVFSNNFAFWYGGAIASFSSYPTISHCTFDSNETSVKGGAIYYQDFGGTAPLTLRSVVFSNNFAGNQGGGLYMHGGTLTLSDCVFLRNGGYDGGAALNAGSDTVIMLRCTIRQNSAPWEGGIISPGEFISPSHVVYERCSFDRNWGRGYTNGDGIILPGNIMACTFTSNTAGTADVGYPDISLISLYGDTLSITQSTFSNNATRGSLLRLNNSKVDISNCIMTYNSCLDLVCAYPLVNCATGSVASVSCSNVFGNTEGDWTGCLASEYGNSGNISADPRFCDTTAGVYELADTSPCTADSTGCGLMGAHLVGCLLSALAGDINRDGAFTAADIIALVNYVFKSGVEPNPIIVADVNADCSVTVADIIYLVNYIFKSGPAPLEGCNP